MERVGGAAPVRVDVRIVAATNRDLEAAVAAGRFRQDLYYRLAVFPVEVPPLRARVGDIRPLAARLRARERPGASGKALEGVTPGALARLEAHDWPGNVRELANVMERASIVATGPTITEQDLALVPRASPSPPTPPAERETKPAMDATDEGPERLEDVERAHIVRILERTGWTIEGKSGAAGLLGLAPSTLRSRMTQLGIARSLRPALKEDAPPGFKTRASSKPAQGPHGSSSNSAASRARQSPSSTRWAACCQDLPARSGRASLPRAKDRRRGGCASREPWTVG